MTIHKSQGSTYNNIVVNIKNPHPSKAALYVAFSRVTTLSGLFIDGDLKFDH